MKEGEGKRRRTGVRGVQVVMGVGWCGDGEGKVVGVCQRHGKDDVRVSEGVVCA